MDARDILQAGQSASTPASPTDLGHRTMLVRVFVICAFVAVTLVGAQFYFGVFKQPRLQLMASEPEDDPNAILKAKDTDHDGISDYDEANLYGTSPYLADSDSDGLDDKTELASGADPNCPRGKSCFGTMDVSDAPKPEDIGVSAPGAVPSSNSSSQALNQLINMKPADVRALMLKNGVSSDVLNKLSDEDLMKAYSDALAQSGVSQAQNQMLPANPSPAAIRKILVEAGMAQADADKLSDEDLVKLYQDTLKSTNTTPPSQP